MSCERKFSLTASLKIKMPNNPPFLSPTANPHSITKLNHTCDSQILVEKDCWLFVEEPQEAGICCR